VAPGQHHLRARIACRRDLPSLDRQPAAQRHRIAGIDGQVQQQLLQLAWVGVNAAEAGASSVWSSMFSPTTRPSSLSAPRMISLSRGFSAPGPAGG
jgi:hypothetical protein